jgi:rod shape-determining protein MreC
MIAFRNTDASGRTSGLLLRCVLYSLLALGLIIFDKRYDHLGEIRRLLSIVAYPVQVAVASPFAGWDWFRQNVSSRETLRADNAELEAQLRLANFRLQRYEALEAETQRLRALRANTAAVANRFLIGNIMDLDIDAFRERVLVDKGARDGVFVGQAVLDAGGVFGQVARVEQLTSEVILVSDASHAIPVQVNRNGLRTIAVGAGDMSRLKLPYLSTSADVVVGDLLVTSGLGGGFPAGYPVGTVAEVKRDPAQSLADVEVRPAAALDRARELLFVWTAPATTPAPAQAAAAPAPPARAAAASQVPPARAAAAASQVPPARPAAASQVPPTRAATASQVPPTRAAAASEVPPARPADTSQIPPARAAAASQVPPARAAAASQVPPTRAAAAASSAAAARAAIAPPPPSETPKQ